MRSDDVGNIWSPQSNKYMLTYINSTLIRAHRVCEVKISEAKIKTKNRWCRILYFLTFGALQLCDVSSNETRIGQEKDGEKIPMPYTATSRHIIIAMDLFSVRPYITKIMWVAHIWSSKQPCSTLEYMKKQMTQETIWFTLTSIFALL